MPAGGRRIMADRGGGPAAAPPWRGGRGGGRSAASGSTRVAHGSRCQWPQLAREMRGRGGWKCSEMDGGIGSSEKIGDQSGWRVAEIDGTEMDECGSSAADPAARREWRSRRAVAGRSAGRTQRLGVEERAGPGRNAEARSQRDTRVRTETWRLGARGGARVRRNARRLWSGEARGSRPEGRGLELKPEARAQELRY